MAGLCREFGIPYKIGYKILTRYNEVGLQALSDRSRAHIAMPISCRGGGIGDANLVCGGSVQRDQLLPSNSPHSRVSPQRSVSARGHGGIYPWAARYLVEWHRLDDFASFRIDTPLKPGDKSSKRKPSQQSISSQEASQNRQVID
jgi:hypothetical protein